MVVCLCAEVNTDKMKVVSFYVFLNLFHDSLAYVGHRVKEDSSYGTDKGLRSPSSMNMQRSGQCKERSRKLLCLPDIVFIGASKTGTSSIAHYILQHPMIKNLNPPGGTNEGHYFDILDNPGTQGKGRQMDPTKLVSHVFQKQQGLDMGKYSRQNRPYVVDYTPNYFVMDDVPKFIKQFYGHSSRIKFLLCLRNPTKRAISSWVAKKVKKRSTVNSQKINQKLPSLDVSIHDGMKQGTCIAECFQRNAVGKDVRDFHVKIMNHCSMAKCRSNYDSTGKAGAKSTLAHVVKSMYAYQLRNWYEYFDPSQFYVFSIEEFGKNPIGVLESIFDFFGLPLYDIRGEYGFENRTSLKQVLYKVKNITPYRPSVMQAVTPQLLEELDNFFRPHNSLLVEILGRDLGYNTTEIRRKSDNSLDLLSTQKSRMW